MSELILRRHMAVDRVWFDMVRNHWRKQMRAGFAQPKRDHAGRFAR